MAREGRVVVHSIQSDNSKKDNQKTWLLSFLLPFLVFGLLAAAVFSHRQYQDITELHPGQFRNYSDHEAIRSALETGVQFGLLAGVPAGLLGFSGYGIFCLIKRKKDNQKA